MDYEKLFEDIRLKAEQAAKKFPPQSSPLAPTPEQIAKAEEMYQRLGEDPSMRIFPLDELKEVIEFLEKYLEVVKSKPDFMPPSAVKSFNSLLAALQTCAMAIWFKEMTIMKLFEAVMNDPEGLQEAFKTQGINYVPRG